MPKIYLCFILFFFGFLSKAQVNIEVYYSESVLLKELNNESTPLDIKIELYGKLSSYNRGLDNDELSEYYLTEAFKIADSTKNTMWMARAIWWRAYVDRKLNSADSLYRYALRNHLIPYQIRARTLQIKATIHSPENSDENYIKEASRLLENWNTSSPLKDSLKIDFYWNTAHYYIHQFDGEQISLYLISLRDYAEQNYNEELKVQAIQCLGDIYREWSWTWPELSEKAIFWYNQLYSYRKKNHEYNLLLHPIIGILAQCVEKKDTTTGLRYFNEFVHLKDSLGAYGERSRFVYELASDLGLISTNQLILLYKTNFDNHIYASKKFRNQKIASFYIRENLLDSAKAYINFSSETYSDKSILFLYYYAQKDYRKAIDIFPSIQKLWTEKTALQTKKEYFERLAEMYAKTNEYDKAYQALQEFGQLKDSLNQLYDKDKLLGVELNKQIEIQEAKYKEEKKQREVEIEKQEYLNTFKLFVLSFGLLAIGLFSIVQFRNNKQRKKSADQIEKAYTKLKSTQTQLIQSEKMASLGELTAGIAHEIQNPLNFVNNFSEVSTELIDEMNEELVKGDIVEAQEIGKAVKENLEKILHHGKRADGIVKGMLQHSRSSSGVKEPTDINTLCDEYLRLAYHGLRAKDKSFNSKFETDFDASIGKIEVIPQDLGRVILNLITNAFYAVNEKKNQAEGPFESLVTVTTQKKENQIIISVKDNGNGIPKEVVDKVFQPFFTTKPTGQGTGLGLSLSYDIVKAHGGELKVESKEGEGSEFFIQLPKR